MAIIYASPQNFTATNAQPAYNILPFIAQDDGLSGLGGIPPVVYCDIYINNIYYKTIVSTSPVASAGSTSVWYFDVSGICQEFMTTYLFDITSAAPITIFTPSVGNGAGLVYCKFRNSTQDIFGVITPGGTPPVQATVDSHAIAGDGYTTDTVMVVNAALQIMDNLNFENQLKRFRINNIDGTEIDTENKIYPLSYAKSISVFGNDWAMFPIICTDKAFDTTGGMMPTTMLQLVIFMRNAAGVLIHHEATPAFFLASDSIYILPTGPLNLQALFPASIPFFPGCDHYNVMLEYGFTTFVFSTPHYYIKPYDGVMNGYNPNYLMPGTPKHTRIWFQNYLGQFDQLNFIEREEQFKVTSSPVETPQLQISETSNRSNQSMSRNNVRSNDISSITGLFNEGDLPFIKQLMASSKVFIEYWPQSDELAAFLAVMVPLVVADASYDTLLFEGRYEYRVNLKYSNSYETKNIRR